MARIRKSIGVTTDPAGEFPFATDDYVLHLLVAIHQLRDSTLDGLLRPIGLNVGRYRVLSVLNRPGAYSMTEVANFTAIDRTTLTRIADQLVASGLVERRTDSKDRRQVRLEITPAGQVVYGDAVAVVRGLNGKLLRDIPEDQRRATARVLVHVVRQLAFSPAVRDSLLWVGDAAPGSASAGAKT